jgi:sucrose-6-phosphate hydrolase SacC (GH32 family)
MKKIAAILMFTFMLFNNACKVFKPIAKSNATTYKNPLPVVFGDPYVLYVKGDKYYMYGTGGVKNGFAAYSSIDLVNWKPEGQVWWDNNAN